ncbi:MULTISPECIES: SpoIIE family protein phosphatase [Streptomyces]|uniref:PAS fold-containing protein n=1 Tax=Streptomyces harbinensis TaxID=1176198 RepID=A0A1I6QK75_9ACTN|nr:MULTISPECIES: SpoIIE family protein phosphatase [Streptomyces]SFS52887.1 PAS fold-containing protein [Streptomyces harbinensis]
MLSSPHSEPSANNLPAGSDTFGTFDDFGTADAFDVLLARARRLREDAQELGRAERSPLRRAAWEAATDRLDEFGRQVAQLRPVPAEPYAAADRPGAGGQGGPDARIGSAEWNLLTDGVVWSDELFAIFGRPVGDGPLTLDQLPSCLVPEDQPVLAAAMTGCLVDGRAMDCEVRVNRPDGTRRTVRMAGEPVLDERGGTVAMWAVIRDVGGPGGTDDLPVGEPRRERQPAPAGARPAAGLREPAVRGPAPWPAAGSRTVPAQRGRAGSLELAARCLPAGDGDVPGGKWYDSLELADGTGVLSLGDLPGPATAGTAGTAATLGAIRGIALTGAGPGDLLGHLNELLDRGRDPLLASAVCCRYRPDERLLTWAQAGHPAPLLCRGGSGRALARPAGPLLGTVSGAVYAERTERLEPGDVLVLHTDGLFSDSRTGGAAAGHDGDHRLLALAGRLALAGSAAECLRIIARAARGTGGTREDDACVLVARVRA